MKKTVTVEKVGIDLPIEVDISRIVAITAISEKYNAYYIYFENAVWQVKSNSYEEVHNMWLENG